LHVVGGNGIVGEGINGVNGIGSFTGVTGSGNSFDFDAQGTGVNYGATSSIRWKKNIRQIDGALDKILRIRGVYFDWDDDHGGQHDMGFIAEEVGKKGQVYATDTSKYATRIAQSRLDKKNHKHVKVIIHKPNSVHKNIPKVDAVISAGEIGSVQEEEHVLGEINKRLKIGSKIVFLDYDKFPNENLAGRAQPI